MGLLTVAGDAAAEWVLKAARLGNTKGMLLLAGCHQEGHGVPRNISETYIWLSLAVRNGYLDAYPIRDEIARQLSAEQRSKADQRVRKLFAEILKAESE